MEPTQENRPTLATAEQVGAQRLEKFSKWVNRLAAPDILLQIGANAAKDRIDAARERVTAKANEIRDAVDARIESAYNSFTSKVDAAREKTIAVAKQTAKRGAILGLTPVVKAEEVYAKIYQLPAGFQEARAEMRDRKIEKMQAQMAKLQEQRDNGRQKAKEIRTKAGGINSAFRMLRSIQTKG